MLPGENTNEKNMSGRNLKDVCRSQISELNIPENGEMWSVACPTAQRFKEREGRKILERGREKKGRRREERRGSGRDRKAVWEEISVF